MHEGRDSFIHRDLSRNVGTRGRPESDLHDMIVPRFWGFPTCKDETQVSCGERRRSSLFIRKRGGTFGEVSRRRSPETFYVWSSVSTPEEESYGLPIKTSKDRDGRQTI